MSTCAIMQPTYLPWSGYFNLIASVDTFVFLDDVQFEKQSWQSRNRILLSGNEHMLSVPVKKMSLQTPISDIELPEITTWRGKHWKSLEAAYQKTPGGKVLLDVLNPVYNESRHTHLFELNKDIIIRLARLLQLDTRFIQASDLKCGGERTAHVIRICEALGCDRYLSPQGARDYLESDGFESQTSIDLVFQSFSPGEYVQLGNKAFASHLSVVDVLANMGVEFAANYVKETVCRS